jgi:hypothetical protein
VRLAIVAGLFAVSIGLARTSGSHNDAFGSNRVALIT